MKNRTTRILQKALGQQSYLFFRSLWGVLSFRFHRKEKDFIYFVNLMSDYGILLDIGASIGVKTHYMASKKKHSIIYAFEPIQENSATLRKIIKLFGIKNIRVMEMALGDKNGHSEIITYLKNGIKYPQFRQILQPLKEGSDVEDKISAPTKRLDSMDVFSLSKYFINGIILNAENFELSVLKGAHLLLQRHRPIVFAEICDVENRKKCFDLMKGYGYEVNILISGKLVPFNEKQHKKNTFFFVPED